jgi:signal transduction histidine kinase
VSEPLWWAVTLVFPVIAILAYWRIARRQVRDATRHLEAALAHQQRIVAQVSHRLRNPLTVIYGFSETLVDPATLRDPHEISSVAAMVNAEALDVSRTVEDLVAAQEVESGEIQMRSVGFDPRDEIERVVTPFRRLGSDISVEAWSGTATSDPLRFRHLLQSLVSNAVHHGGAEISIYADLDGGRYRCTVADDGPGLPEETALRLFPEDRGSTNGTQSADTDSPEPEVPLQNGWAPPLEVDPTGTVGLGLGLAVGMRIASHLGGELTYERAPDFTAFTLSLPTTDWPEPLVPMAAPEVAADREPDLVSEATDRRHRALAVDGPTLSFDTTDPPNDVSAPSGDPPPDSDSDGVREERIVRP